MSDLRRVLAAVVGAAWAIQPEKLDAITSLLEDRIANGGAFDPAEVQARLGGASRGRTDGMRRGGVAVVPIHGVIGHRMGTLEESSGGVSSERLSKRLAELAADPDIGTVVLDIDSPGGTVAGTQELAERIYGLRGSGTRVISAINGLGASAAYWIAAAAEEVVASPSSMVGSVGVYQVHTDISEADAKRGLRRTVLRIPAHKAEGLPYEPLTDDARAGMEQTLRDFYTAFSSSLARYRGISQEEVEERFGGGRSLVASRAAAAGMIDRVATLEDVLKGLGVETTDMMKARGDGEPPRADDSQLPNAEGPQAQEETVADQTTTAPDAGATTTTQPAARVEVGQSAEALRAERTRQREIVALCQEHERPDLAGTFIADGLSVEAAGHRILTGQVPDAIAPARVEMSQREREKYNLGTVMLELITGKRGFAHEVSEALRAKAPEGFTDHGGMLVDAGAFGHPRAALDATTSTAGSEFVFSEYGGFLEYLYNKTAILRMGATRLPGLQGNLTMVKPSSAGSGSWVGDNPGSDVADNDQALTTVTLVPHIFQASTAFSRRLERQSPEAIDQIIRRNLEMRHAQALDVAAMHGASGGNDPDGLYVLSGVNAVAMGGAITWAKLVELESAIEDTAPEGQRGYITTPTIAGDAKVTSKDTGSGLFLWEGPITPTPSGQFGMVNGYPAMASGNVSTALGAGTDHGILFGVWPELLVGEWGALEIVVDPYRLKKQGVVEMTSYHTCDVVPTYPEAFAKGTGLTT